ncbi:hypothetical protein GQR58_012212 [Nymphon striatum]|nr:hypothetical protein GQR58_012212 [Nymphon striatum]
MVGERRLSEAWLVQKIGNKRHKIGMNGEGWRKRRTLDLPYSISVLINTLLPKTGGISSRLSCRVIRVINLVTSVTLFCKEKKNLLNDAGKLAEIESIGKRTVVRSPKDACGQSETVEHICHKTVQVLEDCERMLLFQQLNKEALQGQLKNYEKVGYQSKLICCCMGPVSFGFLSSNAEHYKQLGKASCFDGRTIDTSWRTSSSSSSRDKYYNHAELISAFSKIIALKVFMLRHMKEWHKSVLDLLSFFKFQRIFLIFVMPYPTRSIRSRRYSPRDSQQDVATATPR